MDGGVTTVSLAQNIGRTPDAGGGLCLQIPGFELQFGDGDLFLHWIPVAVVTVHGHLLAGQVDSLCAGELTERASTIPGLQLFKYLDGSLFDVAAAKVISGLAGQCDSVVDGHKPVFSFLCSVSSIQEPSNEAA